MTWLPKEFLDPILQDYLQVKKHLTVEDPEDKPYDSKYEARRILEDIVRKIEDRKDVCDHSKAIVSHLLSHIGTIDMEVDELSTAETRFNEGLKIIREVENQDFVIAAKLKITNQLGLLWCRREEFEKALQLLNDSMKARDDFFQSPISNEKLVFELDDLLCDEATLKSSPPYFHLKKRILEKQSVYTHYYLGQVYEKQGNKEKASECLHLTLKKQIELQEYDPLDWSRNASMLSFFYLTQHQFATARHLLSVASNIIEEAKKPAAGTPDEEEDIDQILRHKADLSRVWGKYCQVLLQFSTEHREGDLENVASNACQQLTVDFSSLGFDERNISAVPAKNLNDATNILEAGLKFFEEARTYYTLDHHCIDYTEITQDLSRMTKNLSVFVTDPEEKFQIVKQSARFLEPVRDALNPAAYLLLYRQLVYELGELYSSMADLKIEKLKAQNPEPAVHGPLTKNINLLISMAQHSFKTFLGTIKTEDGKFPETFTEDTCRPALLATLNLARLAYKVIVIPSVSQLKVQQLLQAYNHYEAFTVYCKKHPDHVQFVDEELPLCEEMVQLLPIQILRLNSEVEKK